MKNTEIQSKIKCINYIQIERSLKGKEVNHCFLMGEQLHISEISSEVLFA